MWDFDTPGPLWDDARFSVTWDQDGTSGVLFAKSSSVSPTVIRTSSVVQPFQ